eukprot:RCo036059
MQPQRGFGGQMQATQHFFLSGTHTHTQQERDGWVDAVNTVNTAPHGSSRKPPTTKKWDKACQDPPSDATCAAIEPSPEGRPCTTAGTRMEATEKQQQQHGKKKENCTAQKVGNGSAKIDPNGTGKDNRGKGYRWTPQTRHEHDPPALSLHMKRRVRGVYTEFTSPRHVPPPLQNTWAGVQREAKGNAPTLPLQWSLPGTQTEAEPSPPLSVSICLSPTILTTLWKCGVVPPTPCTAAPYRSSEKEYIGEKPQRSTLRRTKKEGKPLQIRGQHLPSSQTYALSLSHSLTAHSRVGCAGLPGEGCRAA